MTNRETFEAWASRQGYQLTTCESMHSISSHGQIPIATYWSDATEHAWRGWANGQVARQPAAATGHIGDVNEKAVAATGKWVHCSPSLLNAGVSCAHTPRRACQCETDNGGHDHWIAHTAATGQEPVTVDGLDPTAYARAAAVMGTTLPEHGGPTDNALKCAIVAYLGGKPWPDYATSYPSQAAERESIEAAQRQKMHERFNRRAPTPATADFDLPYPNDPIAASQPAESKRVMTEDEHAVLSRLQNSLSYGLVIGDDNAAIYAKTLEGVLARSASDNGGEDADR
jgi:hypothetical protein